MYDNTIKDRYPVQIQQTLICLLEYRQQLVNLKEGRNSVKSKDSQNCQARYAQDIQTDTSVVA